jgi:hypothetical protein
MEGKYGGGLLRSAVFVDLIGVEGVETAPPLPEP